MTDKPAALSREDRLAAKLRENLHRRKAQARSLAADGPSDSAAPGESAAAANAALPKAEPSR